MIIHRDGIHPHVARCDRARRYLHYPETTLRQSFDCGGLDRQQSVMALLASSAEAELRDRFYVSVAYGNRCMAGICYASALCLAAAILVHASESDTAGF